MLSTRYHKQWADQTWEFLVPLPGSLLLLGSVFSTLSPTPGSPSKQPIFSTDRAHVRVDRGKVPDLVSSGVTHREGRVFTFYPQGVGGTSSLPCEVLELSYSNTKGAAYIGLIGCTSVNTSGPTLETIQYNTIQWGTFLINV